MQTGKDIWRYLVPHHAQSRASSSRLLVDLPDCVLNISKDEDPAASLGKLLQCLTDE